MHEMREAFEREMLANGMFDNGSSAMARGQETGGYSDPDTNAMWAGFCLAWKASRRVELVELLKRCGAVVSESIPYFEGKSKVYRVELLKSLRQDIRDAVEKP